MIDVSNVIQHVSHVQHDPPQITGDSACWPVSKTSQMQLNLTHVRHVLVCLVPAVVACPLE